MMQLEYTKHNYNDGVFELFKKKTDSKLDREAKDIESLPS